MKIIIPGIPIAQTRMKYSSRGGFGRIYDPRAKEKDALKLQIAKLYDGEKMVFPCLSFIFLMPIPKSIPKKLMPLYNSGLLKHDKKPDIDNFVKLYLDCIDGVVFDGDQRVSLGACVKLYHPEPKTLVFAHESSNQLLPSELSHEIWSALTG